MNTFDHFFPRLQGKLGTIVSFIAEVYLGIVNPGDRFKSKVMYLSIYYHVSGLSRLQAGLLHCPNHQPAMEESIQVQLR